MEPYQKAFIELALTYQALRFGQFTLKSGRLSPYFFNLGQLNSSLGLKIIGESYATAIHDSGIEFDVLFGPAYKGIPIVCATTIAYLTHFDQDIPYCFDRKETKDHGEGGQIIGAPLKGRVLILDDVITAGTAIRNSVQLILAQGATIAGIIVALDRQEKGQSQLSAIQEIQQNVHVPVQAIITLDHILEYTKTHPQYNDFLQPITQYREQYGSSL